MTARASSDPAARPAERIAPARSIEDLAREQEVHAVRDIAELSDRWPADADPDDLDQFLLRHRAGRRHAAGTKQP